MTTKRARKPQAKPKPVKLVVPAKALKLAVKRTPDIATVEAVELVVVDNVGAEIATVPVPKSRCRKIVDYLFG